LALVNSLAWSIWISAVLTVGRFADVVTKVEHLARLRIDLGVGGDGVLNLIAASMHSNKAASIEQGACRKSWGKLNAGYPMALGRLGSEMQARQKPAPAAAQ
jgi:hypothetical protein